jgi:hypothetical protein
VNKILLDRLKSSTDASSAILVVAGAVDTPISASSFRTSVPTPSALVTKTLSCPSFYCIADPITAIWSS